MRKIRIKRPQRNPHCAYHYGGHCMNPAHDHYSGAYGMYGMYGASSKMDCIGLGAKDSKVGEGPVFTALNWINGHPSDKGAKAALDYMNAEGKNFAADYAAAGGKFTKLFEEGIKRAQAKWFNVSLDHKDVDGIIGPATWKKMGFQGKSCSSGSSTSKTSSTPNTNSSNTGITTSITDKVWFWPAVGVGGLGLLIVLLKMMKGKKKKKRSSATGSAATPLRGTQASVAGMRRNRF